MAVLLGLIVISRLCISQASPFLDDIEGARQQARYLQSQASNTVPMIGKKAALGHSDQMSSDQAEAESKFLYFLRFLDLGHRGRQSPILGKRSSGVVYPPWFKQDLARLGKRGYPSFSIPKSWSKPKTAGSSLSNLRNKIYSEGRDKRTTQPQPMSWYPRRDGSWFRYHGGDYSSLGSVMYKRGENQHILDFNSVPLLGKRAEVTDGTGLKVSEGGDDVLVRKPREDDDDEEEEEEYGVYDDPWQIISPDHSLQSGLNM